MLYYINKILINLFKVNNNNILLHRWCHPNVINCSDKIINKKIEFANLDNSLCTLPITKKITKLKKK